MNRRMLFWLRGQGEKSDAQQSEHPPQPRTKTSQYGLKLFYEPDEPEFAKLE